MSHYEFTDTVIMMYSYSNTIVDDFISSSASSLECCVRVLIICVRSQHDVPKFVTTLVTVLYVLLLGLVLIVEIILSLVLVQFSITTLLN